MSLWKSFVSQGGGFVCFEVKSICLEIGSLLLWRLLIPAANSLFDVISLFIAFHLFCCGNMYKATTEKKLITFCSKFSLQVIMCISVTSREEKADGTRILLSKKYFVTLLGH